MKTLLIRQLKENKWNVDCYEIIQKSKLMQIQVQSHPADKAKDNIEATEAK